MSLEYNGVKFYGKNDFGIGNELEKAESIILNFDKNFHYTDINAILELNNIVLLYDTGIRLTVWKDSDYLKRKKTINLMIPVIGKFFSNIKEDNFLDYISKVSMIYIDDFWSLFVRFKVYERIDSSVFMSYLRMPGVCLYNILQYKKLVDYYDYSVAIALRESDEAARILVLTYLKKTSVRYYLPNSLKPTEFEKIFQNYIDSNQANPNVLELIAYAQSTGLCPISDKLRLNAIRRNSEMWEENKHDSVCSEFGICIGFKDQDELVKYDKNKTDLQIFYDVKWFEKFLDYPTIMNNFINVFEMVDRYCRCNLVSLKYKITPIDSIFTVNGINFYNKGTWFDSMTMTSNMQIQMYYQFLIAKNINIEDVFKWFFEHYLSEEFSVQGFFYNPSSPTTTYIEKCRNISSEMEGILKQFRMYVRDGEINRELFEMSSEHIIIKTVPSLIENKYAYASDGSFSDELFLLFSDQTLLSSIDRINTTYSTLYELLSNEEVFYSDFKSNQKVSIDWLIKQGDLEVNDNEIIKLVKPKIYILDDLYKHEVISIYKLNDYKRVIDPLIESGKLYVKDTLFTKPEIDYLNYELNKREFSNGLDLRNKYSHATYPRDVKKQQEDYSELIKIMIFIIIKINDEFCTKSNVI